MENTVRAIKPENDELITAVKAEIKEHNLTQKQVATEAGIHYSKLNGWLKGTYAGDNTKVTEAMEQWLSYRQDKNENEAIMPTAPQWVATPTAERIMAALTYAQMATDLVVVYGGAGLSKTTTIKNYKENNPSVWVLESTPVNGTVGGFLRALAYLLKIKITAGHADTIEFAIREKLKDTGGLLIIDEAQFLNKRAIECARRLTELSEVGLALAGNEMVYSQMIGRSRSAEFAQLFSRIGKRVRLTKPESGDVKAILNAWKLKGKTEQTLMAEIAKQPGAIRVVTKVLRLATMFATGSGQPLNESHIRAAWQDLGGNQ